MSTVDPFYPTKQWRKLRKACLKRDGYRCIVKGCNSTYRLTADHILARKDGGADALWNLRTLCGSHVASVREGSSRQRGLGGKPRPVIGQDGWPVS